MPNGYAGRWLLKKKSRLYYGGELEGDFTRSLRQFMSPPGNTSADLAAAESDFADVLAYLKTIEAPKFPGEIDRGSPLGPLATHRCSARSRQRRGFARPAQANQKPSFA